MWERGQRNKVMKYGEGPRRVRCPWAPNVLATPLRQSPRVRGWLPPENILSHHFEKYLHDMNLKLTEHVRNTISFLYKQKNWVKFRYLELL